MDTPLSEAQQLANRYFLAYKDMQDASRYLSAYQELHTIQEKQHNSVYFDHCEGLLCAAIVAYCRPFKKSRSKDFANGRLFPDHLSCLAESTDLHNLLIDKRDTFIAHADWSARSTKLVSATEGAIWRQAPEPSVTARVNVKAFKNLVARVGEECLFRCFELDTGQPYD